MADVVRTITIRFKTENEAQATAATQRLGKELEGVARVSDRNARAALSTEKAWDRLQRSTDQAYQATKRFGEAQITTQKALEQGLTTQQRAGEVIDLARKRMEENTKALREFGSQTKLARFELINLSRQVQDVVVGLASGQRFFTVLTQQGFQIADVFVSSNASLGGFARQIASLITPMRLLVGGMLALGAGAVIAANSWKNWALALQDAARQAGIASGEMRQLQQLAAVKGLDADQFVKDMTRIGQLTVDVRRNIGSLAADFRLNNIEATNTREVTQGIATILRRLGDDQERINYLQSQGLSSTQDSLRAWAEIAKQGRAAGSSFRGVTREEDELIERVRELEERGRDLWTRFKNWGLDAISPILRGIVGIGEKMAGIEQRAALRIDVPTGTGSAARLSEIEKIQIERDQRRIALLGELATASDKLKQKQNELTLAAHEYVTVSETQERTLKRLVVVQDELQRASRRISLLGDIATKDERVAAKRLELEEARLTQAGLTQVQEQKIIALEEHRLEVERQMERAGLGLLTIEDALNVATNKTRIEMIKGNITFEEREQVLRKMRAEALQLVPAFKQAQDAAMSFAQSFLSGLLRGQSLIESLENSLQSLSQTLLQGAFTQLQQGNVLGAGIYAAFAAGTALFGHMLRQDREERERQQRIADNRAQNLGLHRTLLGVIPGSVSETIQSVFEQVVQAGREAAELGDTAEVIRLGNEFQAFVQRTLQEFRDGLPNLIRYLQETATLNNAYSEAAQAMRQLGDALLGIGADISLAGLGGGTETEAQFLAAARGAVLAMVRGAEEMSDLQTALQSAQGAAHEAVRVLQQLGMSAEEAAAAVEEQLIVALDRLRTEAIDQLTRKINELLGKGYINDFLDLFEEVTTLMQDFASLSLDPAMINQFFALAAQDIVNQAQLTGQAFQDLLVVFPQLVGVVTEFVEVADTLDETTARVTEAQENLRRAYEEESRALQQTIDRMRNFAEQLRNLRRSLLLDPSVSVLSPQQRFEEAQRQFRETAEKALTGDEEALGNLQDISKKYLDEAAAYYASSEQYFQAFNEVQSVLEQAEQYASAQVDIAQQQLDALTQQVSLLIDINDSVMSVAEAIEALMGARDWGRRPEANQQLVAALRAAGVDYTGGFGAGQFNVWAAAQSQATQAVINQIVQQMGLQQGGLIRAFNGGLITNGLWNVDSVMARLQSGGMAMLAGGEFVTRAPSVTPATLPTLAHINATGRTPANDNRENFKELARVIMRENRQLKQELAELRAEFRSSMKLVADVTRQTSNEQQRRATR